MTTVDPTTESMFTCLKNNPTRNHMIGEIQRITLVNIEGVLEIIRRLLVEVASDTGVFSLRDNALYGIIAILENTLWALTYEIQYREPPLDFPESNED